MREVRAKAYGKDIGQHSWVTAEELEEDIARLKFSRTSRLLDLGCGPGGPLTFIAGKAGCHGWGVDVSAEAIAAGRARGAALGLEELVQFQESDLNEPTPFAGGTFDAVISLDVILHLRDRGRVFGEVARVLESGGRFLFTDAGVIAGPVSNEEIRLRSMHGYTEIVPQGCNERILESAGFRLIVHANRTTSLLKNAQVRWTARLAYQEELEKVEGNAFFEEEQRYLETVIRLSERGAVARMMYLAERRPK